MECSGAYRQIQLSLVNLKMVSKIDRNFLVFTFLLKERIIKRIRDDFRKRGSKEVMERSP